MILNPQLEEKARTELIAEIQEELKDHKFSVASEDVWGSKDLAYRINGSDKGFYILNVLESEDPEQVIEVSKLLNLKKELWRYMFTRLED